jgi:uncharacterized protein (TIGR02757 family)
MPPARAFQLSDARAARLARHLNPFAAQAPSPLRVGFDPVQFPRRYRRREDVEAAGLLAASLAYGRVGGFVPKLEVLFGAMGRHPGAFLRALDVGGARALLSGFVYRFNVGADVAVLLLGAGKLLRAQGSFEPTLSEPLARGLGLHAALSAFVRALRDVELAPVVAALGPTRGLQHLLPMPLGKGAAKRLNMFLRWMVRGPDGVDLGLWRTIPASALVIPLDTHIARISRRLGLTRRKELSWRTALEVTANLRRIDAADPVRFDFALCHHGMSGVCAPRARAEACAGCQLCPVCQLGRRLTGTPAPAGSARKRLR